MDVNFTCNNPFPSFSGQRDLRQFDEIMVDVAKHVLTTTNASIRARRIPGPPITKLYTGRRFISSSYYHQYRIAYGGRQVTRTAWEYVKLEMRAWSHLHWSVAMNLFVVMPDSVPYVRSKKIFGLLNEDKVTITKTPSGVRVEFQPGAIG